MKPAGKIVLVGNPCASMKLEKDVYWKLLRNQLTVTGTWNSTFDGSMMDDWHYVMDQVEARRIKPMGLITHRLGLESLGEGLAVMHEKKEEFCKVMICL